MSEELQLCHSYHTLRSRSQGLFTDKRSKFISFVIPVESEEEAMAELEAIRKEYYDARHACWAYRIGKCDIRERANDDGEPSSTAGKPILGQLLSCGITDVIAVVVRYFGGVKLGPSGLINAYRTATAEAIENGEIVEYSLYTTYQLSFPFSLINPTMILLKQFDIVNIDNDATAEGHQWLIKVPNAQVSDFETAAKALYQLQTKRISDDMGSED